VFFENIYTYDVVIVGAGGAGIMTALQLSNTTLKIAVITKVHPLSSHTVAAQGGISASLNHTNDDIKWHIYDTIKGGDFICDQDAVETMCTNGPDSIRDLEKFGVCFDRDSQGKILQKQYGGHTKNYGSGELANRACFVADRTGHTILHTLYQQSLKNGVTFFENNFVFQLIFDDSKCQGVVSYDIEHGQINIFYASNIVLATGGHSQVYETTTSSSICTGDGAGLVYQSGFGLKDMEFTQFHPTALPKIGVLISETARSVGGKLINHQGEQFMQKYSPIFAEMSSRDIVSRAIAQEMYNDNVSHVMLDLRHVDSHIIDTMLPNVVHLCKMFLKKNPAHDRIPVAPAAHYSMGGIPTNIYTQVLGWNRNMNGSIIEGLYAVGENACHSVHGANRLGCNSLLDIIVFAKIAALHIKSHTLRSSKQVQYKKLAFSSVFSSSGSRSNIKVTDHASIFALRSKLKNVMQTNVGIFRSEQLLLNAMTRLTEISELYKGISVVNCSATWDDNLTGYFELGNMIACAEASVISAINRSESRGAHYRYDFPNQNHPMHSITFDGEYTTIDIRK
jgi:succinate dehydrogenase/fumarate reductase flavoprotein subunit